jgi:hypothetical protein
MLRASDVFFNMVGLGLALYLAVTVLFTSPILAAGMAVAAVVFAFDIYESVYGRPRAGKGTATAIFGFEFVVLAFFALIIYNIVVVLPYISFSTLLLLIFIESVFAVYAIAKDLHEAYDVLKGKPVVLRYVGPVEVKKYVKEVREEG